MDIEEATTAAGTWVVIETIAFSPLDADPENPATRSFTTEDASSTIGLWYRLVFRDATGDQEQATQPVQNISLATSYGTITELARILKIRTPSEEQRAAMARVLIAAAGEINDEINLAADTYLTGTHVALATEVNLERAVEHWRQQESPFGLVGLGPEMGSSFTARDSWERHAHKLAPLKDQWGLA